MQQNYDSLMNEITEIKNTVSIIAQDVSDIRSYLFGNSKTRQPAKADEIEQVISQTESFFTTENMTVWNKVKHVVEVLSAWKILFGIVLSVFGISSLAGAIQFLITIWSDFIAPVLAR